jgi:hypothetical protein
VKGCPWPILAMAFGSLAPANAAEPPLSSGDQAATNLAAAGTAPSDAAFTCHVRAALASGMLRIEAVAQARSAVQGRYALALLKDSTSGTVRTVQSGAVALAAGEERVLTSVSVEPSAAGHVRAELALDTDLGRTICSYP